MQDFLEQFEEIDPEIHGIRLPKFKISAEEAKELNIPVDIDNKELFKALVERGFQQKLESGDIPKESEVDYRERLNYEVGVVEPSDFVDYFLEVWQDINLARKNNIPVGPGRGCLNGEALIRTEFGLKPLKDIQIGDNVINRFGKLDKVINKFEYESDEKLIEISTWSGTSKLPVQMTSDHKLLIIKNPFEFNKYGKFQDNYSSVEGTKFFNIKKATWVTASNVEKGDYLVRYVGRTRPEKNIKFIDLAKYGEFFDKNNVYEKRHINEEHPLSGWTIAKNTGLCPRSIVKLRNGQKPIKDKTLKKLVQYLNSINVSFNEFQKYPTKKTLQFNRYLNVDENFCYALGFYLGDGDRSQKSGRFELAFNSLVDIEKLQRIKEYFRSLGLKTQEHKQDDRNCIKLEVASKVFTNLFLSLAQKGSLNKRIPNSFLDLPDYKLQSLLDGLIDSDGHVRKDGIISFGSVSIQLFQQTRWLLEYFGRSSSVCIIDHKKWSRSYTVQAKKATRRMSFNDKEYLFSLIKEKKIVCNKSKKVYDISVKNDPSYHTLDYIVHNSAAGSLMLYMLGITQIDSLKYGLYFERFLSESRLTPTVVNGISYFHEAADIDSDISDSRRGELIELLRKKHEGHFVKLSTISTLQSRRNIKEVCKIVLNYSEQQALEISSLVPSLFGKVHTLKKAIEEEPKLAQFAKENEQAFSIALKLSELPCARSSHASAYLLTHNLLIDSVPCELGEGELVSSYDMNYAMLYNIKLDLLGLKAVGIIDDVCKSVGIDANKLDLSYENVYRHLQEVKCPYGLFQISGDCNLGVVNKVKPKNIDDLSAVVALARPGALQFVDRYAAFVNEGKIDSVHEFFDDVLTSTGSLCLFQEQTMKMMEKIGFSKEDGEKVRKLIGKKQVKEVGKWKEKIFDKAKENGLSKEIPEVLWNILEDSANYSFNKSHSVSYATLSATTVYLKFKYPQHFFLACLRQAASRGDFLEHFEQIQHELPHFGIKLLPPNIAKSGLDFQIEGNDIRFGIGEIKGISEKSIDKLREFTSKQGGTDLEVYTAAKEAKLSIGITSSLIQSGALGHDVYQRSRKVLEAQVWNVLTPKEKLYCLNNQSRYDNDLIKMLKNYLNWTDASGKVFAKQSRLDTIRKKSAGYFSIYNLNHKNELLASYFYEKMLLGFSYSTTLKMIFGDSREDIVNIEEINKFVPVKGYYELVATVKEVISGKSKSGNQYLKVRLSDETGETFAMLLGEKLANYLEKYEPPKEDDILFLIGQKGDQILWINKMEVQNVKVYTKLSELKNLEESEKIAHQN